MRLVCAATNLKCSIMGWPENPSLPVTCTPSLRVVTRGECDAGIHAVALGAVEAPEKIEVPPGAAELAVGDGLQADLLLLLDDPLDLAILHRLEVGGADLALGALFPRLLQRCGTQEAADVVGTERGLGSFHRSTPTPRRHARGKRAAIFQKPQCSAPWVPAYAGTTLNTRNAVIPRPRRQPPQSAAASPTARPRPGYCPPRWRRSRIAARGRAGRGRYTAQPGRCGA